MLEIISHLFLGRSLKTLLELILQTISYVSHAGLNKILKEIKTNLKSRHWINQFVNVALGQAGPSFVLRHSECCVANWILRCRRIVVN
jgi:hypothetical protein